MKKLVFGAVCAALATASMAADVGVSINIGEPGFFGQLNIGDVPQPPPVIYARPVVIAPPPAYVEAPPPLYLHVPPGHAKHWASHCREYNACGRSVYFVRDDWYQREYVPHYQRGEWGHREEVVREERRHDHDWDHEHEHGHGHGHGDHDHGDHDHGDHDH